MGGGGVEKWRLKLTSAKVEVEVEAELGNTISAPTLLRRGLNFLGQTTNKMNIQNERTTNMKITGV